MSDPSAKRKYLLAPNARSNPRTDADMAEAECSRLHEVLVEYLRRQDRLNEWLANQIYLLRQQCAPKV